MKMGRVRKTKIFESLESLIEDLDEISETEKAWAAGFFDGEGTFHAKISHKNKNRTPCLAISITNTELEPIERFQAAIGGAGKIYRYERNNTAWKPYHVLHIRKKRDMWRAIYCLAPYLGSQKLKQFCDKFDLVEEGKQAKLQTTVLWPEVQ